jgi:hypothetical protein
LFCVLPALTLWVVLSKLLLFCFVLSQLLLLGLCYPSSYSLVKSKSLDNTTQRVRAGRTQNKRVLDWITQNKRVRAEITQSKRIRAGITQSCVIPALTLWVVLSQLVLNVVLSQLLLFCFVLSLRAGITQVK